MLYERAQQLIAADVPYVSLWYKTNVAVFQPDINGVRLSPIADFTFLKDVSRLGTARRCQRWRGVGAKMTTARACRGARWS